MNAHEISASIVAQSHKLLGKRLLYLSGRNSFTPREIEAGRIKGERSEGDLSIPIASVELYSRHLAKGLPVHVDTVFGASSSHRSALEALVAHLPHAGYLPPNRAAGRRNKMLVWFREPIHPLGELFDASDYWQQCLQTERSVGATIATPGISKCLLTKPFLILTGPSGTGKTRGAIELANTVCADGAHRLVAVGADWTDNRHVLGYLNPLETVTEDDETFATYETTPILDLILHADGNRDDPHVLILDEMNLSHVERYFADFLSAMELEDKTGALKLHTAGMARSRTGAAIPGAIDFPSNLFVIGTVNIDETTYMFSPKVLDRANVIEIHAGETAMGNFLREIEADGSGQVAKDYGIPFLEAARVIQSGKESAQVPPLPEAVRDAAAEHLMALFRIMKRGRAEFGFRTGKEVKAYLRTAHFLAGPESDGRAAWAEAEGDWLQALDAQILQKILPKLHGSRTRLAPMLGALATYCATGMEEYAMEHFPKDGTMPKRTLKDATSNENPKFPESYGKLERMIEVLLEEQFVSFIC